MSTTSSTYRRLTRWYQIALGIIAGLALFSWFMMEQALGSNETSAIVVNLSGRQRMLSQRIGLLSQQLIVAPNRQDRTTIRRALAESITRMDQVHQGLVTADPQLGIHNTLSAPIRALYFDLPTQVDQAVRLYLAHARAIAAAPDAALVPGNADLNYISSVGPNSLLQQLDQVVEQYQTDSQAKVVALKRFGIGALGVMLAALVAEALLIFRPLVRRLERENEALLHIQQQLQGYAFETNAAQQELEAHAQQLHQLHQITVDAQLTFDGKIQALLTMGRERFGMPIGLVSHIVADQFTVEQVQGPAREQLAGKTFPLANTYCAEAVATGGPIAFEHAEQGSWAAHPCHLEFGLEAYLGTPVYVQGALYGTLQFSDPTPRSRPFTEHDREFLRLMAQWIGTERERGAAQAALRANETQLRTHVGELERSTQELRLLGEMTSLVQACAVTSEAYKVLQHALPQLFPGYSGQLAIMASEGQLLEGVVAWGTVAEACAWEPAECWALRRGRMHVVDHNRNNIRCQHTSGAGATLCIPLTAHGAILGMLHLVHTTNAPIPEGPQRLLQAVAGQVELVLANLQLQQTLRDQSVRDPLTGLFNRRYMEESLARELRRSQRAQAPLGIMMIDIDHFKHFNDTWGHDAGDTLLRAIGTLLRDQVRTEDIVCRYGGEEFTIILPDASPTVVERRAHLLKDAAKALAVTHGGQPLGPVTLSIGIAGSPSHGVSGTTLIHSADQALYRAKRTGRDRVVVAEWAEADRAADVELGEFVEVC